MRVMMILILGTILCLASISLGLESVATFYDPPYVPSACYGFDASSEDSYVAGVSKALWKNGRACGEKYEVQCIGGVNSRAPPPCRNMTFPIPYPDDLVVLVRIVDYCSRCPGVINLSVQAFDLIADVNAGVVKISYNQIYV